MTHNTYRAIVLTIAVMLSAMTVSGNLVMAENTSAAPTGKKQAPDNPQTARVHLMGNVEVIWSYRINNGLSVDIHPGDSCFTATMGDVIYFQLNIYDYDVACFSVNGVKRFNLSKRECVVRVEWEEMYIDVTAHPRGDAYLTINVNNTSGVKVTKTGEGRILDLVDGTNIFMEGEMNAKGIIIESNPGYQFNFKISDRGYEYTNLFYWEANIGKKGLVIDINVHVPYFAEFAVMWTGGIPSAISSGSPYLDASFRALYYPDSHGYEKVTWEKKYILKAGYAQYGFELDTYQTGYYNDSSAQYMVECGDVSPDNAWIDYGDGALQELRQNPQLKHNADNPVIKLFFNEVPCKCEVNVDFSPLVVTKAAYDYMTPVESGSFTCYAGTELVIAGENIEVFNNGKRIEAAPEGSYSDIQTHENGAVPPLPFTVAPGERLYVLTVKDAYNDVRVLNNMGVESEDVSDRMSSGMIYNLQGLSMGLDESLLPRGLYIRNGKKLIKR